MSIPVAIEDLRIDFPSEGGAERLPVVDGVFLRAAAGEAVGVVGESGSGKSLTALAMLALLPEGGAATARRLEVAGVDVLTASERRLSTLRGGEVGLAFQDPGQAMNPVRPVS